MNKNEVSFLFICIMCLIEKTLEVHTYSVFKHEHTLLNPWNKYCFTLTPHMLSNKDEIPPWLCRKRAAAPLQTSDFQWIPTLWHFNKTLCHIASAQFGKRLKWRTWSCWQGPLGRLRFGAPTCPLPGSIPRSPMKSWLILWACRIVKFWIWKHMQTVLERLMTEETQRLAVWLNKMP